ncbi:hypothetical protein D3C80_1769180 [compost metagenome]
MQFVRYVVKEAGVWGQIVIVGPPIAIAGGGRSKPVPEPNKSKVASADNVAPAFFAPFTTK